MCDTLRYVDCKYFDYWETVTDETPIPNVWDRFECICGSMWRRIHGANIHHSRRQDVCRGPVTIFYVNPVRTPPCKRLHVEDCNRAHSDDPPKSQGITRGIFLTHAIRS